MNENNTSELMQEGDKFLILLDSILELIDEWKRNYTTPVKRETVPNVLDFEPGETAYYMTSFGNIEDYMYDYAGEEEATHRAFKTREMAEIFADKTQVIADMLHFKQLYDADFEPDFSNANSEKYILLKDVHDNQFVVAQTGMLYSEESVYFSTCEIAQKCADWMNEKWKLSCT
jgi:hypothetical protein